MIYVGDIRLSVLFKEDRYQEDCTMNPYRNIIKNLILRKSRLKSETVDIRMTSIFWHRNSTKLAYSFTNKK